MTDLTVKCAKCGGSGRETYEEDGRTVSDTCYRCAGSGKVDEDTAHRTEMEQVAAILADRYVSAWRKSCNEDPEGEGWAFRAAENMMSEYDYTRAMMYEKSYELGEELSKLSSFAQLALKEALLPQPAPEVATPPTSTSCCRDPKVRGGRCDNCGEWTEQAQMSHDLPQGDNCDDIPF